MQVVSSFYVKDSWHERYPNLHAASLTRSLAYRCGSPIRTFPYAISLSRFRRCLAGGHGDEPDQREVSERQENGAPSPSHSHMPLERLRRLPGAILRTLDDFLMPRERGDMRDVILMSVSLAVLVYFSMQLYRVYAHLYYAAGLHSVIDHFY